MMHFNQLTPPEAERLSVLVEELGEVQAEIAIVLLAFFTGQQFSYTNLETELGDVFAALHYLSESKDIQDAVYDDPALEGRSVLALGLFQPHARSLLDLQAAIGNTHQAIGKIQRHGFEMRYPADGPSNRQTLERQIVQLLGAIKDLILSGVVDMFAINTAKDKKLGRAQRWLHYPQPSLPAAHPAEVG
jgi:hypothetical protein